MSAMKITVKELSPKLWPDVEALFGEKGAVGGCWCMSWRVEKGEDWGEIKGAVAKARFKKLVTTGKAFGVIAYGDGKPVGWCSIGPRRDYAKLDRAPSFKCDDADEVWSAPCFYVAKEARGFGVGTQMLALAEKIARKNGAKALEGYPVKTKEGKALPAAFVWTGTTPLFEKSGYVVVGNRGGGKERVRKAL